MKVGIFYSSLMHPTPSKILTMNNFTQGVIAAGDEVINFTTELQNIDNIDAAFVMGYSPQNNSIRSKIFCDLNLKNIPTIFVDSNIFGYSKQYTHCSRYSINGVYPSDGDYFLYMPFDSQKLEKLLIMHDCNIKPWRKNGNHILVLGQRTMGWSMLGINRKYVLHGFDWLVHIIEKIKFYSDRPIVVRLHPHDYEYTESNTKQLIEKFGNTITISVNKKITEDLNNAWCCVGFNSSPNCASAIEGVPVYLDDPINSWAKDIAFDNLEKIENPPIFDRKEWLHKISHIHYTADEIKSGLYWKRFKYYYT